jgi:hypothetical protein
MNELPDLTGENAEGVKTTEINIQECLRSRDSVSTVAEEIFNDDIKPALEAGNKIVFDFSEVFFVTPHFFNTVIASTIDALGRESFKRLEFKHTNPELRSEIDATLLKYAKK